MKGCHIRHSSPLFDSLTDNDAGTYITPVCRTKISPTPPLRPRACGLNLFATPRSYGKDTEICQLIPDIIIIIIISPSIKCGPE